MKVYYSESHRQHFPPFEVFDGGLRVPYLENPDRMDTILGALRSVDWAEILDPMNFCITISRLIMMIINAGTRYSSSTLYFYSPPTLLFVELLLLPPS